MTKRNRLLAFLVAGAFLLAGCSKKEPVVIQPEEAAQAIQEQVEFKDSLVQADETAAAMFYRLDDSVAEHAIYISGSGATAEEVAVLKVQEGHEASEVEAIVNKRVEDLKFNFENYRPEEMAKLENPIIVTQGGVVFFVSADSPAAARKAVDSLFK